MQSDECRCSQCQTDAAYIAFEGTAARILHDARTRRERAVIGSIHDPFHENVRHYIQNSSVLTPNPVDSRDDPEAFKR
jgi:hypothetical protein